MYIQSKTMEKITVMMMTNKKKIDKKKKYNSKHERKHNKML